MFPVLGVAVRVGVRLAGLRYRRIDPGTVLGLELPLEQAAAGYRAMDQREAIKVLLRP